MVKDGAIESIGQYMATEPVFSINIMLKRNYFASGIKLGRRSGGGGPARSVGGWRLSVGPDKAYGAKDRIACPGTIPQKSCLPWPTPSN